MVLSVYDCPVGRRSQESTAATREGRTVAEHDDIITGHSHSGTVHTHDIHT